MIENQVRTCTCSPTYSHSFVSIITGILSIEVNRSRVVGTFVGAARYKVGLLGIDMDSSNTASSNESISNEV